MDLWEMPGSPGMVNMIRKTESQIRVEIREAPEMFSYDPEFKKGYIQALLWVLGEDCCQYCGDPVDTICPRCGKAVCEECRELPCANDHKEPEHPDYLRASPQEQAAELRDEYGR